MCKKLVAVTHLSVVLLCVTLLNPSAAIANSPLATRVPFIYRIIVSGCNHEPTKRVQTGFRVKGLAGIVTALHGVAGCNTIFARSDDDWFGDLTIARVDIENDLALLWSAPLAKRVTDGLKVLVTTPGQVDSKHYANIVAIGFPLNLPKARRIEDVRVLDRTALVNLLPNNYVNIFDDRKSPALDAPALSLQALLSPGTSGAPLINSDGYVVGVVEGGLGIGSGIAWAIPWDVVRLQSVSQKLSARLNELAKKDPQLAFSIAFEKEPIGAEGKKQSQASTSCDQQNPFALNPSQLDRLGCSDGGLVSFRYIVTQEFEHGFMIVFDDPNNSKFVAPNQQRKFYALADDGRAWRVFFLNETVPQNSSPNQQDWYTCEKPSPFSRPENSGIPWRGFGMVWCNYAEIKQALGKVKPGAGEVLTSTSFQSYFKGRVFQKSDTAFSVYLNTGDDVASATFLRGSWERVGPAVGSPQNEPVVAPAPPVVSSCVPPWFFQPHPAGCILQFREISAEFQNFQNGRIVYLADVAKSFVLFDGNSWLIHEGVLASASAAYAGQLGQPTTSPVTIKSCAGHTNDGTSVTAYVKDPFGGVTSWTILIDRSGQRPGKWRQIRNLSSVACR
jgi:hypothetical protein